MKLLEENRSKIYDIELSNFFLICDLKSIARAKIGWLKVKKLLYSKGIKGQSKRQPTQKQKIFANNIYLIM